jgi:hypothetical protein
MAMLRLPNCTAICLDTVNHEQARRAAECCDRAAEFRDIFILSDRETGFATRTVAELKSIEDYNDFIVNDLVNYCETEFVLIFQWDGFITRPDRWLPAFMDFDYVGAPWVEAITPGVEVGNGGFSLRSRRLLEACARFPRPAGEYEDMFVCHTVVAESPGLTIAPMKLARAFSVENDPWSGKSFGFHGSWHFPQFMDDEEILERLPLQTQRFWETDQVQRWIHTASTAGKPRLAQSIFEACRNTHPD